MVEENFSKRSSRAADEERAEKAKAGLRIVDRRRFDSDGEEKDGNEQEAKPVTAAPVAVTKASIEEPAAIAEVQADREFDFEQATSSVMSPSQQESEVLEESEMSQSDSESEYSKDESDISFGSFVLSLATQALVQLGQVKPPEGMPIPVDPVAAKQTIDILSMLEIKTKGNLDSQEERLLREALHNLRLSFLRFR